jgi:hypothetical protein
MEADVLSRWRRRSMAAGWSLAEDWWTPEAEGVVKAVCGACDLSQACWALGSARAAAGVGIAEGMNDLAALFAVTGAGGPPFAALRRPRNWPNGSPRRSTWPPRCGGPSPATRRWRCWGPYGWGP